MTYGDKGSPTQKASTPAPRWHRPGCPSASLGESRVSSSHGTPQQRLTWRDGNVVRALAWPEQVGPTPPVCGTCMSRAIPNNPASARMAGWLASWRVRPPNVAISGEVLAKPATRPLHWLVGRPRLHLWSLRRSDIKDPTRSKEADVELQEEVDLPQNDGHRVHMRPGKGQAYRREAPDDR